VAGSVDGYAPLAAKVYSPGVSIDFVQPQISALDSVRFLTTIINLRASADALGCRCSAWMAFIVPGAARLSVSGHHDRAGISAVRPASSGRISTIRCERRCRSPALAAFVPGSSGCPEFYLGTPSIPDWYRLLPTYSKKPLFSYPVMVYSGISRRPGASASGLSHVHLNLGMGPDCRYVLRPDATMLIAIPTGASRYFNWIATGRRKAHHGAFRVCLVVLFTIGGISESCASPPAGFQQADALLHRRAFPLRAVRRRFDPWESCRHLHLLPEIAGAG